MQKRHARSKKIIKKRAKRCVIIVTDRGEYGTSDTELAGFNIY